MNICTNKSRLTLLLLILLAEQTFAQNFGRTANGEMALRAVQKTFPDKTGEVAFIDNDWTLSAGNETFFWAGGRLLPRAERDQTDSWDPHLFYIIPGKPAPPDTYPPQYIEALRTWGNNAVRPERKDSHRGLQGILYGGLSRREIETHIERIEFLGFTVNIHNSISEALKRIDEKIQKWDVNKTFINSIESIGGYNWRQIAGSPRMSYHSWGLAVDILPKSLGNKSMYWFWERARNEDWMLVPLGNRWNPPDVVIAAFEQEGFIWGGKWPFYDNMHFEYRPELHEFSRLLSGDSGESGGSGIDRRQDLHHIAPDIIITYPNR